MQSPRLTITIDRTIFVIYLLDDFSIFWRLNLQLKVYQLSTNNSESLSYIEEVTTLNKVNISM
jgi:hypothetical protein